MTLPWIVLMLALWAVVLLLGIVVLGLLRRIGPVLEAAEGTLHSRQTIPRDLGGLQPGAHVPDFRVATLPEEGEARFDDLLGEGVVVLFVQEHCPGCATILAELSEGPQALDDMALLVIADPAEATAVERLAMAHGSLRVALQRDAEASQAFAQFAFPQAFAVDGAGTVRAQALPSSVSDLLHLAAALHDHSPEGPERRHTSARRRR